MSKTAKFRHVGPGGYVAIGFNGMTRVETDTVIELPDDDEAVRPYHQVNASGDVVHRDAQTTADCYRNQPEFWEEIPDTPSGKSGKSTTPEEES